MSKRVATPGVVGALSGALFAVGLALSGMTDPSKVLGFLDVTGAWDPSLIFVMGGAVGFHFIWLRFVAGRYAANAEPVPAEGARVDARLIGGAAIFGVGWGMAGYCPGPALVSLAFGRWEALLFTAAMLGGMLAFRVVGKRRELELSPSR